MVTGSPSPSWINLPSASNSTQVIFYIWPAVSGVAQSQTRLKLLSSSSSILHIALFPKEYFFCSYLWWWLFLSYTYMSHEQCQHLPSTLKWYPAHWTNNLFLVLTPYLPHILLDRGPGLVVLTYYHWNLQEPSFFAFFVNPTWLVDTANLT